MFPQLEYWRVIDEWIQMTPKSNHIVSAYAVLKDHNDMFMQVTECCSEYNNMYDVISELGGGWQTGPVPSKV